MRKGFPHLIYISLLLGCGGYFARAIGQAEERLTFISQSTQARQALLDDNAQAIQTEIREQARLFRNPFNDLYRQRSQQVDSLIDLAADGQITIDSLRSWLYVLVDKDAFVRSFLVDLLPVKRPDLQLANYRMLMRQDDSLRLQMVRLIALQYCKDRFGTPIICKGPYTAGSSFTTLCPGVHQAFQADFVIMDYAPITTLAVRINDQTLPYQNGIGAFDSIFTKSGTYPLRVEIDEKNLLTDSIQTIRKTFYLQVRP